jgi:hypothetical protein
MSNDQLFDEQQMDSDSEEYDDEINYDNLKQEGESNNGTVQQSMKHFQPTSKMLSKYVSSNN